VIKLVYCLRRLRSLSFEQFSHYWRTEHAALVLRHAPTLGVLRYVQCHATAHDANAALQSNRALLDPYDGVAEIYFESLEALEQANLSEQAQAAQRELTADEDRFLDRSRSSLFIVKENVVIGAPTV
jgi:uncharacterized protein (TIGR02118 family)